MNGDNYDSPSKKRCINTKKSPFILVIPGYTGLLNVEIIIEVKFYLVHYNI